MKPMSNLLLELMQESPVGSRPVEIVERKGLGHPDTICDMVSERFSVALSRHYLELCGSILHHNVDKALLVGGQAAPAFGGGDVLQPIEIPAFIITGHPSLAICRRAAEAGIRLVEKPLLGDDLAKAIREALNGQVPTA
jgi:S-adenosylmethionine synthetase